MSAVTTPLIDRAESIFADLGYAVTVDGGELRAERKWRTVRVTPVAEPTAIPESGDYRCFVTPAERVDRLERELHRQGPDYEWAIIGVSGEQYEVAQGP